MKTVFIWLGCLGSLLAQSNNGGALNLTPPLNEVFPMVQGSRGVEISAPVLLNLNTIIPQHAALRVCYLRPQGSDLVVKQIQHQQAGMEGAIARPTEELARPETSSPEVIAAVRIATQTCWPNVADFQHAFVLMDAADMRLVFVDPATGAFEDEIFNLPEGLLLSEQDSKVLVLGVENQRSGAHAGFLAGDQLLSVGGVALDGTLTDFVKKYRQAQVAAEGTPGAKVVFKVQRKNLPAALELAVSRPLSLKGSILDMN